MTTIQSFGCHRAATLNLERPSEHPTVQQQGNTLEPMQTVTVNGASESGGSGHDAKARDGPRRRRCAMCNRALAPYDMER